jgi:hypothetical protein
VVVGQSIQLTAVNGEIWDDPDMQISPGDHKDFATGETWSLFIDHKLPEDMQVGSSLRAQLRETKINGWDWGNPGRPSIYQSNSALLDRTQNFKFQ